MTARTDETGLSGEWDIAVIGAGIAGASVASELARSASVVLIEREDQPGYHTTGRSAALFSETYGPPAIRALTRASAAFYRDPPPGFATAPLLTPRGVLMVARVDQQASVDKLLVDIAGSGAGYGLDGDDARRMLPLLREGYASSAVFEPGASDIDVHALHQGYLRRLRADGGLLATGAEVSSLDRNADRWRIGTKQGAVSARIVVNAAGAWADEIAGMAGIRRIGLVPKRRTAMVVQGPAGIDRWPMAVDIDEAFYLKPDAGRLLLSPADETPSRPCDAQPEELDIAICVDRIERAFDLSIRQIERKWAGLRSFVADKTPVAGYAADAEGFFWLAGQGGYGIQTAPALARMAAAMALGRPIPGDIAEQGLGASDLSPGRLPIADGA